MTLIPAVVELAPVAFGRGGYPSSKHQDRFSIANVENDESGCLSFLGLLSLGKRTVLENFLKGCDDGFDGFNLYILNGLCRD